METKSFTQERSKLMILNGNIFIIIKNTKYGLCIMDRIWMLYRNGQKIARELDYEIGRGTRR